MDDQDFHHGQRTTEFLDERSFFPSSFSSFSLFPIIDIEHVSLHRFYRLFRSAALLFNFLMYA